MSFKQIISDCFRILFIKSKLSVRQKWILGLLNLSSVVIFWVLSSFLVSDLFEDNTWRKPFFMTYLNTGCFMFYLIPYLISEKQSLSEFYDALIIDYHEANVHLSPLATENHQQYGSHNVSEDEDFNFPANSTTSVTASLNTKVGLYETVKLSSQFAVLWFSANLVTNASLSYTSVASQTILSTTSSFFTLLVGFLCSVEKININKVIGLILSFMGVVIVTEIDSNDPPAQNSPMMTIFGNTLALSGALFYGIYTILLKRKVMIPNSNMERELNAHLFFAFVGIFTIILLFPILIILHFTGLETLQLPPTLYAFGLFCINILITFISDLCWCKAVLLTSPLTVTVGLSMTIPLAMIGDWLIKGFHVNFLYLLGAIIVTIGFMIINKDEEEDFVRRGQD